MKNKLFGIVLIIMFSFCLLNVSKVEAYNKENINILFKEKQDTDKDEDNNEAMFFVGVGVVVFVAISVFFIALKADDYDD